MGFRYAERAFQCAAPRSDSHLDNTCVRRGTNLLEIRRGRAVSNHLTDVRYILEKERENTGRTGRQVVRETRRTRTESERERERQTDRQIDR